MNIEALKEAIVKLDKLQCTSRKFLQFSFKFK